MSKHFNASPVFLPPLFFFLILCFINSTAVVADPRATEAALICTNETALISQRQSFISSFLSALNTLTPLISRQKYAAVVNGTGENTTVYAFGECIRDLSAADCDLCFAQCKTQILRCLPFQKATLGGRLFYDGCYIRYDRFRFFNQSLSGEDKTVCGVTRFRGNSMLFETNVRELVRRLRVEAVKKDGFFVANVSRGNVTVYGLAQCWELVSGSGCVRCLSDAAVRIGACNGKEEGRVLNAGCYLRYSMQKFYNNDTVTNDGGRNGGRSRLAMVLAVTSAAFAVVFAVSAFGFLRRKKLLNKRKGTKS